jgi:hypothetical protein
MLPSTVRTPRCLAHVRSRTMQRVPAEVGLPHRQRGGLDQLGQSLEVARLADDHVVDLAGDVRIGEEGLPVEAGHDAVEVGDLHLVVGLHRIAVLDLGPLDLRDLRFEREHAGRVGLGVLVAAEREHAFDVADIGVALGLEAGVAVEQVVVAVGQAEAALAEVDDVLGRILVVLVDATAERSIDADHAVMGDESWQVVDAGHRVDAVELGLQRLHAEGFELAFIHEARIQVADLLLARIVRGLLRVLDDDAQVRERLVVELVERAIAGLVGGNLGRRQPMAVDVLVEVVLCAGLGVHVRRVQARGKRRCGGRERSQQTQPDCGDDHSFHRRFPVWGGANAREAKRRRPQHRSG